jgi:Fe-S cluster biogenesis protein NfuA
MEAKDWLIMPGGLMMLHRRPFKGDRPEGSGLASLAEMVSVNPEPFPWGHRLDGGDAGELWRTNRLSVGGLVMDDWYVTLEGVRVGGQPQVSDTEPNAAGRYFMYLHGGPSRIPGNLEANEGWALTQLTTADDQRVYYMIQEYASKRVVGDGGRLIVSPVGRDGKVFVGVGGRCFKCGNWLRNTFPALKAEFPELDLEMYPEYQNWDIAPAASGVIRLQ